MKRESVSQENRRHTELVEVLQNHIKSIDLTQCSDVNYQRRTNVKSTIIWKITEELHLIMNSCSKK